MSWVRLTKPQTKDSDLVLVLGNQNEGSKQNIGSDLSAELVFAIAEPDWSLHIGI